MYPARFLAGLAGALALTALLPAQNCANTSIGETPLTDLGTGTYQGFQGGLYGGGSNVAPTIHLALGAQRAALVVPRDPAGNPAPNGRIVLLSIGMSNTTQEFSTWEAIANADPNKNPAVTIVDGAQGGQDAVTIANPAANFWAVIDQRLANHGTSPNQVQAVWLKQAIAGVAGGFPAASQQLQGLLQQIVVILKSRYPNLQLCFLSSRTYAGYAVTQLNPEPYAYESGFAVQWLLQQQLAGDPALNADPNQGPVTAPWLGYGPYLWADGVTPRLDGFTWTCADVQPDGTHPSINGRQKVAGLLQAHFTTHPMAQSWYYGGSGTAAGFVLYGQGCPGSNGVPNIRRSSTLPIIGNANFAIGTDHAHPSALAALMFGLAPADVPFAGPCHLQVAPPSAVATMFLMTSPNGTRVFPLPIPADPNLIGLELFAQWAINDPQGQPVPALQGLALSQGARIIVGL